LRKGYVPAERYSFKVEFDTTSSSGTQLTPYIQQNLDNNVEGELKAKCGCKDFTITSTENTRQDVSIEFGSPTYSKGIKWTVNASSNVTDLVDKLKGKATIEFKNDYSNSSLSLEHPLRQSASQKQAEGKATFNTVVGSKENGVALGFDSELSLATYSLNSFNTTFAFNKSDGDFALFWKQKFGSGNNRVVGANVFHKLKDSKWNDTQIATEISFDTTEKTSAFALGLSFKPSDSSSLKTRYDSKGLFGFLYTDKLSGPLSVAFGADWNVLGGGPLQHSIKLTFK